MVRLSEVEELKGGKMGDSYFIYLFTYLFIYFLKVDKQIRKTV